MRWILRISLWMLFLSLAACGDTKSAGASSPTALLEKLVSGLEEMKIESVVSCFDSSKPGGKTAVELTRAAMQVLQTANSLETTLREKFGSEYADAHVAVPELTQMLSRLRSRMANAKLVQDNYTASFLIDGIEETKLTQRDGRWFLATGGALAEDGQVASQALKLLSVFATHLEKAGDTLRAAQSEAAFRDTMQSLGQETKTTAAPILVSLLRELKRLKIYVE